MNTQAEDVGALARMVPLPNGVVVRSRDEDFEEIVVFGWDLRLFSIWTRCALRVTGAHHWGTKGLAAQDFRSFQTARERLIAGRPV